MDPILIHIGYHKTGSGWLRRLFFTNTKTGFRTIGKAPREHPVRRLVRARPFEFEAAAARAEFDPLLRPVQEKGLVPVVAFERFSGHPFSGGYDSKEIANRLAATFPEGLVLVVVREQGSMIISTYKQYVREGGTLSLKSFLKPPTSKSMRMPWFDRRHFAYHHLLSYYRNLFGPERILALTFEQFVSDPAAFVSEIGRFAGRPLSDEVLASLPFDSRSNPSPSATAIAVRRRLNWLGVPAEMNPTPMFRSPRVKRTAKHLAQWVEESHVVPRALAARQDAELRQIVGKRVRDWYAESNRVTAELTGIDLARYGWQL